MIIISDDIIDDTWASWSLPTSFRPLPRSDIPTRTFTKYSHANITSYLDFLQTSCPCFIVIYL